MSFLKKHWDDIQTDVPFGNVSNDAKAVGYIRPWNHDKANMDMILRAMKRLKPIKVLELGTFEGLGTKIIAETMSEYLEEPGEFYTFDIGKCPAKYWPEEVRKDIEAAWPQVEKIRDERTAAHYENVILKYIEGFTFEELPWAMLDFGIWDFCFQDSVHDIASILEEWGYIKPFSKIGSLIVFDDIHESHPFLKWFPINEPDWEWRHTKIGRQQLWAERIKL